MLLSSSLSGHLDAPTISFLSLESDFLKSVSENELSIIEFASRFAEMQERRLDQPTSAVAFQAATNIITMSTSFTQLQTRANEIENELLVDIEGILDQLTLEDKAPGSSQRQETRGKFFILRFCSYIFTPPQTIPPLHPVIGLAIDTPTYNIGF